MKTIRLIIIFLAFCLKTHAQESVDLGLSVCWASCNIGASSSKSIGEYYIWNTSIPSSKWGDNWRMPTQTEAQELINKCTWTKTSEGYKIKGPNGNEIFMPITGFEMDGSSKIYSSTYIFYWTTTQSDGMSYALSDQSGIGCNITYNTSMTKMAIRPVCSKSSTPSGTHSGDLGLSVEWSLSNFNSSEVGERGMIGPQRLANLNLKDGWRLPTKEEIQELIDKCSWTTTTVNGYSVFKATSPNGNYIYFPQTGYMPSAGMDGGIVDSNYGYYWTSTKTGSSYYVLKIQSANNLHISSLSDSYSAAIRAVKTTSNPTPTETLDVSSTSLSFSEEGSETISVNITSNTSYSITVNASWIKTSISNGTGDKELRISVQPNFTNERRSGHITIYSPSISKTITITQQASSPRLSVSPSGLEFMTGEEETKSVDIVSNTSYSISTKQSWIVLSQTNGTGNMSLSITVAENTTGGYRTGYVLISYSNGCFNTVGITQYGKQGICSVPVDLGLQSGILWATCNLGAQQPEELGAAYEWAVTEIGGKTPAYDKSINELFYEGIIDINGNLSPEYDVASVVLGNGWRIPTNDEMEELINNCRFILSTKNGVDGYTITGKNGNSIFLPMQSSLWANYATSTPYEIEENMYLWVYMLRITSEYYKDYGNYRNYKYFVRPVIDSTEVGIKNIEAVPNDKGCFNVYNYCGVSILKTQNQSDLKKLPKGIYLINDKKVAIQ